MKQLGSKACTIIALVLMIPIYSYGQETLNLWLIRTQSSPSFKLLDTPIKIDSTGLKSGNLVFLDKEPFLFYIREGHDGDDIYAVNYASRSNTLLAHSREPVSSLRLTPDGKYLSCMLKTDKGKKNLVKFPLKGGNAIAIMDSVEVDNYIWIDDNAMLGIVPGTPNSLEMFGFRPRDQTPVVVKVGQELAAASSSRTIGFVHKISVDIWAVKGVYPDGKIRIITEILPDNEVFTLTSDGRVILHSDQSLQVFNPQRKNWQTIELPPSIGDVKAIQLNQQGDYIAILATAAVSK